MIWNRRCSNWWQRQRVTPDGANPNIQTNKTTSDRPEWGPKALNHKTNTSHSSGNYGTICAVFRFYLTWSAWTCCFLLEKADALSLGRVLATAKGCVASCCLPQAAANVTLSATMAIFSGPWANSPAFLWASSTEIVVGTDGQAIQVCVLVLQERSRHIPWPLEGHNSPK